jgi:hypothetical protein
LAQHAARMGAGMSDFKILTCIPRLDGRTVCEWNSRKYEYVLTMKIPSTFVLRESKHS